MRCTLVLFVLAGSLGAQTAPGKAAHPFRTTRLFGDHMVLPAATNLPIVGFGPARATVSVQTSWDVTATATVADDGTWRVPIATPARGGPFELTLRCDASELVLRDVLVGDVWLGSGQSNMEMPIGDHGGWRGGVLDAEQEIAAANHPQLRVFTVTRATSGTPLQEVDGSWQIATPKDAAAFSASAYFFGRELLANGRGPIGLIVSAWGGTVCEAWTDATGLQAFPEFAADLAATQQDDAEADVAARRTTFWRALPTTAATNVAQEVTVPDLWSRSGLAGHDGVVFYRRRVALPAALTGKDLTLDLGAIDDMDRVWCNGVLVGGLQDNGAWATPRRYPVAAGLLDGSGELDLLVQVVDTGGEGCFGRDGDAVQVTLATDPEQGLSLAGTWTRHLGPALRNLPPWPRDAGNGPNRPAVLWNAMVAPWTSWPVTGVLWYQGESNRGRDEQYARLFPAMITSWRRAFARELPFYFVQIAPFGYENDRGETARLRQAQAAALALPKTGMVVTLDIGDADDIHPRDKQSVGKRLALQALRGHYGQQVVADGPRAQSARRLGTEVLVAFDGVDLVSDGPVLGFELGDATGAFHPARARIENGHVLVRCDAVALPTHVRHAWAAVPTSSLSNRAGLPAWPFSLPIQ